MTNLTMSQNHVATSQHPAVMPMTHLPETRASNPALETRKCDMLSSAGFSSCGSLARYSTMLYSTLESGINGAL